MKRTPFVTKNIRQFPTRVTRRKPTLVDTETTVAFGSAVLGTTPGVGGGRFVFDRDAGFVFKREQQQQQREKFRTTGMPN